MSAEITTAVQATLGIIQIAQRQGWLGRLRDIFRKKNHVLLLGSAGTGKSNFIDSLKTQVPSAIDRLDRTERGTVERVRVGVKPFVFYDTPGHDGHAPRRMKSIREALHAKHLGIIHVVCAGYHEYSTGAGEALDGNRHARPEWLDRHRTIEFESMCRWLPIVAAEVDWFFTVITKADLWWHDRESVVKYYSEGRYADQLRNAGVTEHSILEYSSVSHRFYGDGLLSPTFDGQQRKFLQQKLLAELLSVVTK
jgi:hypothetical protein